jgi:hypothetical protein
MIEVEKNILLKSSLPNPGGRYAGGSSLQSQALTETRRMQETSQWERMFAP